MGEAPKAPPCIPALVSETKSNQGSPQCRRLKPGQV